MVTWQDAAHRLTGNCVSKRRQKPTSQQNRFTLCISDSPRSLVQEGECSTRARSWDAYSRRRKIGKNAARERGRVQQLRRAFADLQNVLPNVPAGTKLSKLDILLLATDYIRYLTSKLPNLPERIHRIKGIGTLHPIKKWPMRSRLYMADSRCNYRYCSCEGQLPDRAAVSALNQRFVSRAVDLGASNAGPACLDQFQKWCHAENYENLPCSAHSVTRIDGLRFHNDRRHTTCLSSSSTVQDCRSSSGYTSCPDNEKAMDKKEGVDFK